MRDARCCSRYGLDAVSTPPDTTTHAHIHAHSQDSEAETQEDEAGQEDTARADSTAVASAVAAAGSDASGDEGYRTAEEGEKDSEKKGAEATASEEPTENDAVLAAERALEQVCVCVRERETNRIGGVVT